MFTHECLDKAQKLVLKAKFLPPLNPSPDGRKKNKIKPEIATHKRLNAEAILIKAFNIGVFMA